MTKQLNLVDRELTKEYLTPRHYNSKGASAANKKRFPDGYIYIVKLRGHDLYKIGVSNKPKRRIFDLNSASPFGLLVVCVAHFKNVYEFEEAIHDSLIDYMVRKEWFDLSKEQALSLKEEIIGYSEDGIYLMRRQCKENQLTMEM